MLKKIAKALFVSRAWIISTVFLVAIWAIIESSEPFQYCIKERYARAITENFEKSISSVSVAFDVYRVCLGHFTHDNAEAIIAAFTIILAFSTIFLWVATRDLVRGAEQTAERQLRAYISIDQAMRRGPDQLGPQFTLSFQNCGQTPAYKGTYWADIKIHEFPWISDLTPSEKKKTGIFELPPTNIIFVLVNDDNVAVMSQKQVSEFNKKKIAFYIFGQLDFLDAFDKPRWLKFRFRYGAESVAIGLPDAEEVNSN